jgi:hypothetical protein
VQTDLLAASLSSFGDLSSHHCALNDSFALFQCALVAHRWSAAVKALEAHRLLLGAHLAGEDTWLLPAFGALPGTEMTRLLMLEGQHKKIQTLLARVVNGLAALGSAGTHWPEALLRTLDIAGTYSHLCEHHHEAEERWLFPSLDAHLPQGDASRHLRLMDDNWHSAIASAAPLVAVASRALAELPILDPAP